jgi:hypothetical protein
MAPRIEIKCPKLLLVEGADALHFFIKALEMFRVDDVQVLDFGGISDLTNYLKALPLYPDFDRVTSLAIARDAETNSEAAISNVKKSLKQTSFSVPDKPFEFTENNPKIAFMIFPGFNEKGLQSGTLEDLCLDIVKDCSTFDCVDAYIQCLQSNGYEIKRPHKTKLHAYLSGKNDFVGLKIGEAAKAGAWDWDHAKFKPFKDVIIAM